MADKRPDPRSGVDEEGRWSPAFPGQRPPLRGSEDGRPFEEGNEATVRHGARSERRIAPLAAAWEERLRSAMAAAGVHDQLDDVARFRLARLLGRAQLYEEALDETGGWLDERGELTGAARELFRLDRSLIAQLRELGLTVKSRAEIGLSTAQARQAIDAAEVSRLVVQVFRAIAEEVADQALTMRVMERVRLVVESESPAVAGALGAGEVQSSSEGAS